MHRARSYIGAHTVAHMPPTEEQAATRVAQLKRLAALFKHLRLGVTLVGMRELLEALPNDKLEQVNLEFRVARDEAPARPNWPWSARAAFRCFF